jgi:hypothetical protein
MTSEWEEEIQLLERETKISNWEDVLKFYKNRGIYEDIEQGNIIVLDKAVWMKINIFGVQRFRKVKAISNFTVYYDSCYSGLYSTFHLGSLDHRFTIDGETLDLTHVENPRRREMLLEFIKRNTEPSLPPVPKGILKL